MQTLRCIFKIKNMFSFLKETLQCTEKVVYIRKRDFFQNTVKVTVK